MSGMHVDEHEARSVLREDVHAVQLGNGNAERLLFVTRDERLIVGALVADRLGDTPWTAAFVAKVERTLARRRVCTSAPPRAAARPSIPRASRAAIRGTFGACERASKRTRRVREISARHVAR